MMNKIFLVIPLLASIGIYTSSEYNGSTIASVNIAGGIIKAQHVNVDKKYKRSECPVCKGQGWYISGDEITKVPCGYCEPEKTEAPKPQSSVPVTTHNNRTRVFKQ